MGAETKSDDQRSEGGVLRSSAVQRISEAEFLSWKRRKDDVASARRVDAARKRAEEIADGAARMTGRELFIHEPWVFDNSKY
ncbi:zinc finger CCCH domain protein [Wolffia australiana]